MLDAGSVYATLTGRFNPAGFAQFDGAMKKSGAQAAAFEKSMVGSQKRSGDAVLRASGVYQDASGRWRESSGRFVSSARQAELGVTNLGNTTSRQSRRMTDFQRGLGGSASAAESLGRGVRLGALASVVALGYGTFKAVQTFAGFEKQLNSFKAVSGATAGQVGQAERQIRDLGVASGLGATKVAQAATELAKGGLSVKQILGGGLKAATDLAIAGELDLAAASSYTANALNLFGLKGKDAGMVANSLAVAANSTTADIGDFGLALSMGGAAAKQAGLSFQDTIIVLEALANAGVKGSDAGTSMKSAFLQVSKPTAEAAAEMDRLGLKFFTAQGNMRPVGQIAGMLREKLGGLTREQRINALQTIAGTDGFRALAALYDEGAGGVEKLTKAQRDQSTIGDVVRQKNEGIGASWNKLKAAGQEAMIAIGQAMAPGIGRTVDEIASRLREWSQDGTLDSIAEDFGAVANAMAAATPVILDIVGALSKFGGVNLEGLKIGFLPVVAVVEMTLKAILALAKGFNALPGPDIDTSKIQEAADDIEGLRNSLRRTPGKKTVAIDARTGQARKQIDSVSDVMKKLPKGVTAKIAASDAGAQKTLKTLTARLLRVESADTVAKIIGNSRNAEQAADRVKGELRRVGSMRAIPVIGASIGQAMSGIGQVKAGINSIRDKNVTIRQTTEYASKKVGTKAKGRPGRDGAETAVIGEGRGPEYRIGTDGGPSYVTQGPELAGLFSGDYIVPTEPAYRQRGIGLWMMAGRDLGVPGFKKGRAAKKAPARRNLASQDKDSTGKGDPKKGKGKKKGPLGAYVPAKNDPLSLPVSDMEAASDNARQVYEQAAQTVKDLQEASRTPGRENKRRRANAKRDLPNANAVAAQREADWRQRQAEVTDARKYASKIREQEDEVELARQGMELADRQGNQKGYDSELKSLQKGLGRWSTLITAAQKRVPQDTDYWRELDKVRRQIGIQADEANNAQSEQTKQAADAAKQKEEDRRRGVEQTEDERLRGIEQEADRFATSGMTPGEVAEEERLEQGVALAELTDTKEDDKAAGGALSAFWDSLLGQMQGRPVKATAITAAARSAKSAREYVKGLTDSTAGGADADLQAQLDQANERTRVAQREGALSRSTLAAFGSSGDIGQGGRNAYAAAGGPQVIVQQTNQMLHPSDPAVLDAIGRAATSGMSYQGSIDSPRVKVGP